jgi:hypothetical protein
MAKKTITVEVDNEAQYDLIQAGADARNTTPSKLLQSGENLNSIANDQAWQALNRLIGRGVYPAEIVAEAKAEAARQVASRAGVSA